MKSLERRRILRNFFNFFSILIFNHMIYMGTANSSSHKQGSLNLLLNVEEAQLRRIFSDLNLAKHYLKTKDLYQEWAEAIGGIKLMGKFPLSQRDLSRMLSLLMLDLDTNLRSIWMVHLYKRFNISHEELCDLLARNVLSGEPVLPER